MLALTLLQGHALRLSGLYIEVDGVMRPISDLRIKFVESRGPAKIRIAVEAPLAIAIDRLDAQGNQINGGRRKQEEQDQKVQSEQNHGQ